MSSSSPDGRASSFLFIGLGVVVMIHLSLFLLAWTVDPIGLLGPARAFPSLCPEGVKARADRQVVGLLPAARAYSEIIVGNSRVAGGFSPDGGFPPARLGRLNLAIDGARISELEPLLAQLHRDGSLDKVWMELTPGLFFPVLRPRPPVTTTTSAPFNSIERFWYGAMSWPAMRAAWDAIYHKGSCLRGSRDSDGFATDLDRISRFPMSERSLDRRLNKFARGFRRARDNPEVYRAEVQSFTRILEGGRATGTQFLLVMGPIFPAARQTLRDRELDDLAKQWKEELRSLVEREIGRGGDIILLDRSELITEETVARECTGAGTCPFRDLTHFTPSVGAQLIRDLAAAEREKQRFEP